MMDAIRTFNLTKWFPRTAGYGDLLPFRKREKITAVEDISLDIKEGEFFGLLGPNGAGKTTLIKLICSLVLPSSGTAQVFGHDIVKEDSEVKKLVGLVSSEERSFYWRLTGRENLQFFASLYHLKASRAKERIQKLLDLVGLADKADIRFQNYSTGMRQKLAIARGLLGDPPVLFVDEPTRSLDPVSAQAVRSFFKEKVSGEGKTVILATHNLNEAEQLCTRLAIMNYGRLKASGSVKELRAIFQQQEKCVLQVKNFSEKIMARLLNINGVHDCHLANKHNGVVNIEIRISERSAVLPRIMETMVGNNIEVCHCQLFDLPLEEIFTHVLNADGRPKGI
jgi:ABC-2 type transport system ATP-binding protein